MTIVEDSNNKVGEHITKHQWWENHGIEIQRYRLPVGDYVLMNEKMQDVILRKTKRNVPIKMMDFMGTYNVCTDSKFSILELCGNFQQQHERFRDELLLAKNNGIKLYILVENDFQWIVKTKNIFNNPVRCIADLNHWKNPRAFIRKNGQQAYPNCAKGSWLAKVCTTCEEKYGCKFVFCKPEESAEIIVKILTGEYTNGDR